MRRLLTGVFAASFLIGMLTGCSTTSSCSTCGTGGCGTGSCGSTGCSTCGGGCGSGGCGAGGIGSFRLNMICHTTGVCDCDHDEDPCAHRAPWAAVRPINYPMLAKAPAAPAGAPVAPVDDPALGAASGSPQAMPTSNIRR